MFSSRSKPFAAADCRNCRDESVLFFPCPKKSTGFAPHNYVVRQRIGRTKRLLIETRLPIIDIVLTVGCVNHSHFSTRFRRIVGVSQPSTERDKRFQKRKNRTILSKTENLARERLDNHRFSGVGRAEAIDIISKI